MRAPWLGPHFPLSSPPFRLHCPALLRFRLRPPLQGYHSLYRWYRAFEALHFPDPMGLRQVLERWTLGLYPNGEAAQQPGRARGAACASASASPLSFSFSLHPVCFLCPRPLVHAFGSPCPPLLACAGIKWVMAAFDVPEAICVSRTALCTVGGRLAALTRIQASQLQAVRVSLPGAYRCTARNKNKHKTSLLARHSPALPHGPVGNQSGGPLLLGCRRLGTTWGCWPTTGCWPRPPWASCLAATSTSPSMCELCVGRSLVQLGV